MAAAVLAKCAENAALVGVAAFTGKGSWEAITVDAVFRILTTTLGATGGSARGLGLALATEVKADSATQAFAADEALNANSAGTCFFNLALPHLSARPVEVGELLVAGHAGEVFGAGFDASTREQQPGAIAHGLIEGFVHLIARVQKGLDAVVYILGFNAVTAQVKGAEKIDDRFAVVADVEAVTSVDKTSILVCRVFAYWARTCAQQRDAGQDQESCSRGFMDFGKHGQPKLAHDVLTFLLVGLIASYTQGQR